ncbi:alpha-soluble NSF attachment protein-like [Anthonomus grandis grandis]|uniref:alpha-soluble NSF attachment protein-like n=1 Tax=Anthonomus grandis grandis TaxID=2921223 RepID=UPI0021661316|nr:alpha-soluble NSF attachment protein-like [Anthonomus grandis grandis]
MASHIENKAIQLRNEAQKKMNPGGFLQAFFSSGKETLEAIDYYTRAGNLFKMAKNWVQAGLAFIDAANLNCKTDDLLEAAINYTEAANCFKKCDYQKAIESYYRAIKLYTQIGKVLTAAKLHESVAEMMEDERELSNASRHYELASELFRQENHMSNANKCLEKVAELAALAGKYQKAIKIFQEIACYDLSSSLLQFNAKGNLFRAAICHLCNDRRIVETMLNTYTEMLPSFENTREYDLILSLLKCLDQRDLEEYANALRIYHACNKLSIWHVTMLLKAKEIIESDDSLRE